MSLGSKRTPKAVHLGTSPNSKGGIASVLGIYEKYGLYANHHLLVETHRDGSLFLKSLIFVRAITKVIVLAVSGRVNILHLHTAAFRSFWRKSIFFRVGQLFSLAIVLHWHSPRLEQFISASSRKRRRLIERFFRTADSLVVASDASGEELETYFKGLRWVALYNPTDLDIEAISDECLRQNEAILFMAAMLPEKGIFDLVDAFVLVRKQSPETTLIMCGSGQDDAIRDYARKKSLESVVEFPGWVTSDRKVEYFHKAAVFCLPSYADTFAMANLEAMTAGLPVVSTLHGGIPEVVVENETGFLVPPKDPQALATALLKVLDDRDLRCRMGEAGAKLARSKFGPHSIFSQLEEIYLDALDKKS